MAYGNPNTAPDEAKAAGNKSPTGLLPFNAFGGKTPEVGDVCSFRVVQVYDDQVEVEYAHDDERDTESPELGEAPPEQMTDYLE